jgi:hypothetical protein
LGPIDEYFFNDLTCSPAVHFQEEALSAKLGRSSLLEVGGVQIKSLTQSSRMLTPQLESSRCVELGFEEPFMIFIEHLKVSLEIAWYG